MSTTNTDRYAKQLAADWVIKLSAARDIRAKQLAFGAPSINDLMPTLLRHFDHKLRDFGALCLGVNLQPSRVEFSRFQVPDSDVRALVGTSLAEGRPLFANTGRLHPAVVISGGSNSGKTTMLHSLIEQAAAVTSPIDTGITVLADEDAPIRSRLGHHADRISFPEPDAGLPSADSTFRQLVFIDDADLHLPENPHRWRQITEAVTHAPVHVRVYLTAATAAPRVLPSALLANSVHVNLRGGTLPIRARSASPWRFTSALSDEGSNRHFAESGFCFSDLPTGNSPVGSGAEHHAFPEMSDAPFVPHAGFDSPAAPASVGFDTSQDPKVRDVGGEPWGRVFSFEDVRLAAQMPPALSEFATQLLLDDIDTARMACEKSGHNFDRVNSCDDIEMVVDRARSGHFPWPVWRAGIGRFLAEDPGTWDPRAGL